MEGTRIAIDDDARATFTEFLDKWMEKLPENERAAFKTDAHALFGAMMLGVHESPL
jgi:hypothetical protein